MIPPKKISRRPPASSIEPLEQRIAPATFTVMSNADSGAGSSREAQTAALASDPADLRLAVSGPPEFAKTGDQLTYQFTVTNDGPDPATGVQLIDMLPAKAIFVSATSSQGTNSQSNGTVNVNLGDLANGASATVSITVRAPDEASQLTNNATVSASTPDSNPDNNAASATTIALLPGNLVVSDQKTPAELVAAILGTGVTVSNVQFAGTGTSAGTFTGGRDIIGFESGVILSSGAARNVIGPNRADVSAENGLAGDTDLDSLTSGTTSDATVLSFDFVPQNNVISFQYVFSSDEYNEFANSAFNDVFGFFLNGVNVAKLPGTTTAVSINTVNGGEPFGTNAQNSQFYINNDRDDGGGLINTEMNGLTVVFSVQAPVTPGQISHIKLAIADTGDSDLDSNVFIRGGSFTDKPPEADLAVTLTDSPDPVMPGTTLTYLATVTNNGPTTATAVKLSDVLPANVTFVSATPSTGTSDQQNGTVTVDFGALNSGASAQVQIVVMPTAGGSLTNSVSVSSTVADSNTGNNSATAVTTLSASGPDLTVSVSDNPSLASRGGTTVYTTTFANRGTEDASRVVLTETLPANTVFNSAASSPGWAETGSGSGIYRLDLGSLPKGAPASTATFAVNVPTVLPLGYVTLSSTVSIADAFQNETDVNPLDNTETETTPIYQGIHIISPGVPNTQANKGAPPIVRVFDIVTGNEAFSFQAYESSYRDSIRVAAGDLNGDGFDDIITSTRLDSGRVRVFDGKDGTQFQGTFSQIDPFSGKLAHGAFVASGDVTGDGRDDIIVGSGRGGGMVKVYDGVTGSEVNSYIPFTPKFNGGVRVAAGDVNGDGIDDVIVGQGDSGSRVKVYNGGSTTVLQDFDAAPKSYRNGIFVAAGDLDGDGKADIITGRDIDSPAIIRTFSGLDHHELTKFSAFGASFKNGVRVAAADVNFDGIAEIIATSGAHGGSQVKIFDVRTSRQLPGFTAFPDFPGVALFAAGSATVPIPRT